MKYSSARQLELDYSTGSPSSGPSNAGSVAAGSASSGPSNAESVSAPVNASETLAFPDFGRYDAEFAQNSKLAGRINAAAISEGELRDLLRERKRLVTKKLENNITRKESNRLEYVRWTLDRIEDARDGHVLEAIETSVRRYEQLADDLTDLYATLGAKLPTRK